MTTLRLVFSFLALFLIATGCNPPTEIGASFLPDASFEVLEDDELLLNTSTVLLEDISSRGAFRLLAGTQRTDGLGEQTAVAYVQLAPDELSLPIEDVNYTYDSLALEISYDGYYVGDTSQEVTLLVYRINEDFEPQDDDDTFYTYSELSIDLTPLGSVRLDPDPFSSEPISVRLDDELGREFFDKLLDGDEDLFSTTSFINFFSGIQIRLEVNGSLILGFSPEIRLDLHYCDDRELPAEPFVRSFMARFDERFNQLSTVFTDTTFVGLEEGDRIPSAETSEVAYLQGGTALATRIDFTDWAFERERYADILIRGATLRIEPAEEGNYEELPEVLTVYWVDADNDIIAQGQSAILNEDLDFGRDTYYEMDVSNFVDFQLLPETTEGHALLLTFDLTGSTTETLLLKGEEGLRLNLSYLALDLNE